MPETKHYSRGQMMKVSFAGLIGTTVEFYDFYIFGTAAALVFSSQFFPALGPAGGTLAALATFGVAFVARPFGSILFGHFGDRIGRKATLVATLLMMGGATVAIGVLPSAATIGGLAPVLLVLLRIIQGIAVGGEWAGAVLLTGEHAPPERRGFYALFPQLGPALGLALSMGTFLATSLTMSPETFQTLGWRIPFLASFILVVIGLFVRLSIEEPQSFAKLKSTRQLARNPLFEVVRKQPVQVFLGAGSLSMVFALFHTGATWLISYGGTSLKLSNPTVLSIGIVGALIFAGVIAASASASDRFGRKPLTILACVLAIPWALVLMPIVNIGSPLAFAVGLCVTLAIAGIGYGPVGAQLPELFHTRYRYTGAGVAYSLAGVVGGALPPFVAQALIPVFGEMAVGYYLAAYAVLSLLCLLAMKETRQANLDLVDAAADAKPKG
ncbi:MFS transporter [Leucobacter ruminantium]|uniref:MHS family MFS transporter n=1 Tax=Leucobacter ruminantium TaxID=1289170 RepID=A0A939M0H0_9MICO|nr:MFS transporter [Leucobacter ruminantium]MBO1806463.1 MHS family MFS transporter [Leucobacter ruminantium]